MLLRRADDQPPHGHLTKRSNSEQHGPGEYLPGPFFFPNDRCGHLRSKLRCDRLPATVSDHTKDWEHAGGKLAELGPAALTEAELLSILVAPGTPGNPAEKIAENILKKFGSLEGLGGQPLERLYEVKGMGNTKIIRLAAALEIARRVALAASDAEKEPTAKK